LPQERKSIKTFCVQCHLSNGEGVSGVFPPLKASDYLFENINRSIAGIKYGLKGEITVNDEIYDGVMANQGLEEEEIADVMNYILNQWGNQSEEFITPQQVAAVPKSILQKMKERSNWNKLKSIKRTYLLYGGILIGLSSLDAFYRYPLLDSSFRTQPRNRATGTRKKSPQSCH
jgi:cytochrome c553